MIELRNRLLAVLFIIGLVGISIRTSNASEIEKARCSRDPYFRSILGKHLKPKYSHTFTRIDPSWRIEKHWLKSVPNAYEVLDIRKHPEPHPKWLVSLEYFKEGHCIKTLRMTQQGTILLEREDLHDAVVVRRWYTNGTLREYTSYRDNKMMAGLGCGLNSSQVSSFQDGRGTFKRYSIRGILRETLHIWDGVCFCSEVVDKSHHSHGINLFIPGSRMNINGDSERLSLDKGHEEWTRNGVTIDFRHMRHWCDATTGKCYKYPAKEISDVPDMPMAMNGPQSSQIEKRARIRAEWKTIYTKRRSEAIKAFRAYFILIKKSTLFDRLMK